MKYCNNCGKAIEDDAAFCNNCGAKAGVVLQDQLQDTKNEVASNMKDVSDKEDSKRLSEENQNLIDNNTNNTKTNNNQLLTIFLWIFFLPVMLIITIVKNENISKKNKVIFSSLIVFLSIFFVAINQNSEIETHENEQITNQTSQTDVKTIDAVDDKNNKKAELSEEEYKSKCVDLPWSEVVKDRKTYVNTYLKKDLMVRQIAEDSISGETVYICGEKKADNSYVGGTFTVYDRRSDKSQPIELGDILYVYGRIVGIYMTYSSYNPEYEVKYIEFNGKFGQ